MQFPDSPAKGDQVTNPSTGAVYEWDGLMWVNLPPQGVDVQELTGKLYAIENRQDLLLAAEKRERQEMDECLQTGIDSVESYDDGPISAELHHLQEGFDAAVVAAQEGAENLTLELQSYSKKGHEHPYLPLSGGELTNTLTGKLIKSVRSTGYAFEAKPDNGTTTAFIRTDGSAGFTGSVKVDDTELARVDHTHDGYAASDHNHGSTYAPYSHVHSSYANSNHTHAAYAAVDHTHPDPKPRFRWKAVSHQTAENLQKGEFFKTDNHDIYFHPESADGINLNVKSAATAARFEFLCSVHTTSGNSVLVITANEINFNNSSNKYIRVRRSHHHYSQDLTVGTEYHLNIPGFTH